MSNTITIQTELSQEDRERIDLLTTLLSSALVDKQDDAGFLGKRMSVPQEVTSPAEPDAPAEDKAPWEGKEEPLPQYTAADVRALVQKLATPAAGKKDAVKKIVNEYAAKVGDIPEDKYPEVMAKLLALQEG